MKKYILALALLFVCHIGFAQDLNSLFDEFKKEPNADCISISPFMMAIGKMFMGNDSDAKLARKFKSIRILDLEACSTTKRWCR